MTRGLVVDCGGGGDKTRPDDHVRTSSFRATCTLFVSERWAQVAKHDTLIVLRQYGPQTDHHDQHGTTTTRHPVGNDGHLNCYCTPVNGDMALTKLGYLWPTRSPRAFHSTPIDGIERSLQSSRTSPDRIDRRLIGHIRPSKVVVIPMRTNHSNKSVDCVLIKW